MSLQKVWIGGRWRDAQAVDSFRADDPAEARPLADEYPISRWEDLDEALSAAAAAAPALAECSGEQIAAFLEQFLH